MNYFILVTSIFVVLIDQLTKILVSIYLKQDIVLINNLFSLSLVNNDGAAWNMFSGRQTFLVVITLIILLLVYNMMYQFPKNKINNVVFGLLLGGIFGNLIDRIFKGYVIDFISISTFPVFNIADCAITVGVIALIIQSIRKDLENKDDNSRSRKCKNR